MACELYLTESGSDSSFESSDTAEVSTSFVSSWDYLFVKAKFSGSALFGVQSPFSSLTLRGCIQKFPDWLPGARTANDTAVCD
jgi:hypothetical protein